MKCLWFPCMPSAVVGGLLLSLSLSSRPAVTAYERNDILSDGALNTPRVDPNLVNPWGLASSPTGPFWIANEGTGTSSVVLADGSPFIPDVLVPGDQSGHPTGLVFNGGGGFEIAEGASSATSLFLFVTLDGRVMGWNPNVDPAQAIVAVDNRGAGPVYTGAAIASHDNERFLYVANFAQGSVDVFDEGFNQVDSLSTPNVPSNYGPFGIAEIRNRLYVTFAQRDPATGEDVPGHGHGFLFVLSPDGSVFDGLVMRGELDAPWGVVLAPGDFGEFSHKLLVGNFGDGRILAYNIRNGHFLGNLEDESGDPIVIPGLWGLLFGNGGSGGEPDDLYFTAGIEDEQHGVFGEIEVAR
jgi:uncharacterized protein (TIGR03118 family)